MDRFALLCGFVCSFVEVVANTCLKQLPRGVVSLLRLVGLFFCVGWFAPFVLVGLPFCGGGGPQINNVSYHCVLHNFSHHWIIEICPLFTVFRGCVFSCVCYFIIIYSVSRRRRCLCTNDWQKSPWPWPRWLLSVMVVQTSATSRNTVNSDQIWHLEKCTATKHCKLRANNTQCASSLPHW